MNCVMKITTSSRHLLVSICVRRIVPHRTCSCSKRSFSAGEPASGSLCSPDVELIKDLIREVLNHILCVIQHVAYRASRVTFTLYCPSIKPYRIAGVGTWSRASAGLNWHSLPAPTVGEGSPHLPYQASLSLDFTTTTEPVGIAMYCMHCHIHRCCLVSAVGLRGPGSGSRLRGSYLSRSSRR